VPRFILILTACVLLAAGCRGPRYNADDQPATEPEVQMLPALQEPAPARSSHKPAVVTPPPVVTSAPWVAVSGWARENQLPPPQRLTLTTNPVFEIRSGQGVLAFQTGTQRARFNGLTLWLGYEPLLVDGKPCLHERDVAKNLEPLLLQAPSWKAGKDLIVIDPGHGGGNTGTRSADGKLEKDYTLDWARRLQPLLESNGWTVLLTRTNDAELTLPERVAFAEAAGADLFISLHFNASGGGNHQAGLETYCLTPTGMPSNLTRDFEDDLILEYPNNTFDAENLQFAVGLHGALLQVNGGEDRGLRRARFMGVLRGQNRPAVLVEGGFLSNPAEAARIQDPEYRQNLAAAVAAGLGTVEP
jgi:N-acetylmuramoyl-L-alanine amidase